MSRYATIGLLAALALFCVVQALYWLIRSRRRHREAALVRRMRAGEFVDLDGDDGWRRAGQGEVWIERFASVRRLGMLLAQAGFSISVGRLLTVLGVVLGIAWVLIAVFTGNVLSGFVIDLALLVFIYLFISTRRRNRLNSIDEQLPQALELMIFSLRAGHPLEQAIRFVSEELPEPFGPEMRRCYEEYEMGRSLESALTGLAQRLDACRALRTFVEAVVVLKQTGGNLVEVMEQIISTLRAQAAYEARYRALTAEGRTSGMILGSLPLLILAAVLLIQPGYLGSLLTSGQGRSVLLLALFLWGAGITWLTRLVRPAI